MCGVGAGTSCRQLFKDYNKTLTVTFVCVLGSDVL
jgi:hypothetical protein